MLNPLELFGWIFQTFSSSIENLQVQRGIGTSVNGSSAFGASINILTDKISKDPFFESNNSLEAIILSKIRFDLVQDL